jgi:hypothetical protein
MSMREREKNQFNVCARARRKENNLRENNAGKTDVRETVVCENNERVVVEFA